MIVQDIFFFPNSRLATVVKDIVEFWQRIIGFYSAGEAVDEGGKSSNVVPVEIEGLHSEVLGI